MGNEVLKWEESIKDLEEAIRLDPKNSVIYFNLGVIYFLLNGKDRV